MSQQRYDRAVKKVDEIPDETICKEGKEAIKGILAEVCGVDSYKSSKEVKVGQVWRSFQSKGDDYLLLPEDKLLSVGNNTYAGDIYNNYPKDNVYFKSAQKIADSLHEYFEKRTKGEL